LLSDNINPTGRESLELTPEAHSVMLPIFSCFDQSRTAAKTKPHVVSRSFGTDVFSLFGLVG